VRIAKSAVAADVRVTWDLRDPLPSLALFRRDVVMPILHLAWRSSGKLLCRLRS
jgi:hypothetical protein